MTLAPDKALWTVTTAAAAFNLSHRSLHRLVSAWEEDTGREIPRLGGHSGTGILLFTRAILEDLAAFRIARNEASDLNRGRGRRAWHGNSRLMGPSA